jgi:xanthine/CO dehydrogenase XdhC/CoxF family maturation factor
MKELPAILAELVAPGAAGGVLATLVTAEGSSYRRPGARLFVNAAGRRIGSISGGCLEEDVLARAAQVRRTGTPEVIVYDTTSENDLVWGVGLGCHGVVRVLLEPVPPRPAWALALAEGLADRRPTSLAVLHGQGLPATWGTRLASGEERPDTPGLFVEQVEPAPALVIFGAGDDAQPLARLAKELGWYVAIGDPRATFATRERFPTVDRIFIAPAEQLAAAIRPDARTLAAVMTHHYVHDVPLLRDLLPQPLLFLGLLGPRKRAEKILGDLAAGGLTVTREMQARFHAPIGLDLGADAPEQVALAILAEMQAVLGRRDGRPLRERKGPIHG